MVVSSKIYIKLRNFLKLFFLTKKNFVLCKKIISATLDYFLFLEFFFFDFFFDFFILRSEGM